MLKFDAKTAEILGRAYAGRDITARRRANFDALAPRPGEVIADLGAGAGHLSLELSHAVGPDGRVLAIDPAPDMMDKAREHCAGCGNVEFLEDRLEAMPVADATLDAAVSVQVFEYIADIPAALAECRRALRPGGRLVIGDMHWASLLWQSDLPDRMAEVLTLWEGHLAVPDLPARLPSLLAGAGFGGVGITPLTFVDSTLRADGLAQMMLILIEDYVAAQGDEARALAGDWAAEQRALAAEGRFFHSITHYVTTAIRC